MGQLPHVDFLYVAFCQIPLPLRTTGPFLYFWLGGDTWNAHLRTQIVIQIPPEREGRLPPLFRKIYSQNPTILYTVLPCLTKKDSLVPFGQLDDQAMWISGYCARGG